MIGESLIGIIIGSALAVGYAYGRIAGARAARKSKADADKAEEILNAIPQAGPYQLKDVLVYETIDKTRHIFIKCMRCAWSTNWKAMQPPLKLCGCDDWRVEHFHTRCISCGGRALVRTRDDVDRPVEPVKPSVDKNACKCGFSDATSAEMASGVPAWKCRNCGELRPKLVGGVTPVETN